MHHHHHYSNSCRKYCEEGKLLITEEMKSSRLERVKEAVIREMQVQALYF